ncbi:MAG: nitrogen regulation protein NR(II) [Gammaproteobacteria bacterium]
MLDRTAHYIDLLQTAVILVTNDLTVQEMNSAAENMLGVSSKRLSGRGLGKAWVNLGEYQGLLSAAIDKQAPISQHDVVVATSAGTSTTYFCAVTPRTGGGEDSGLLVEFSTVDVSQSMIRDTEARALTQISEGMLRGFAHEVKNPLGGIRGAAQLLLRELPEQGLQEYTEVIMAEVDRLGNLVDRMLAPNAAPTITRVNLHEVLARVQSLVSIELPDSITLSADYDPSIPEILGDAELLIQAVLNIVRNAMQALLDAQQGGEITMESRLNGNMTNGAQRHLLVAHVYIKDSGPGVPPELQSQIFYPLITGRAEGTGLGLPITQSLISQQGGAISFTSRPGKTVFTVYLPIAD